MKKKSLFAIILLGIITVNSEAQNVGINNNDPKAAMDINGGFRLRSENTAVTGPNVLLTTNRSHHVLVGSPVADFNISFIGATENGQHAIISNTTLRKGFLVPIYIQPNSTVELIYSNGAWKLIGSTEPASSTAWGLTGNAGTDTSVNFIGTTDDKPLKFKVNNQPAGLIDANTRNTVLGTNAHAKLNDYSNASANVAIGANALSNDTSGNGNTAVGYYAMEGTKTSGSQNTGVGSYTLQNVQGAQNSAFGSSAMGYLRTGNFNTAVGAFAYNNTTSGTGNTAVGVQSMYGGGSITSISGNYNTAVGMLSLKNNIIGNGAVAIGHQAAFSDTAAEGIVAIGRAALYNNINKTGNLAIGDSALYKNGVGSTNATQAVFNTAVGSKSLLNNSSGSDNTALGYYSLYANEGGQDNTAVGKRAMYRNIDGFNNTALGSDALLSCVVGSANTAVGASALLNNNSLGGNTAIGNSAMVFNNGQGNTAVGNGAMGSGGGTGSLNVAIGLQALKNSIGNSNIAIGYQAGADETGSNKLYIQNSNEDKNNTLIYGDFAADSLNLNAKVNIRDFTRLGSQVSGAPAIKMKKISIPSGPAINGVQSYPLGSGITDAKVVGIQVLMNYAGSWKIPPSYIDAAGYEYNVQVQNNNIVIVLKNGNSANIGGKPISVIVTYEE